VQERSGVTAGASAEPSPGRACPLCGGPNACVAASSGSFAQRCWCEGTSFSPALLERVPAEFRDVACICAGCAGVVPSAA
jgi:hypothetical protein